MYCGDETGSFIGQIGSHTSRFGYGGDESPRVVLPSYVGQAATTTTTATDAPTTAATDARTPAAKHFVPASCYRRRWAEPSVTWQTPRHGPSAPATATAAPAASPSNRSADHDWQAQPVLDPAAYLSQGGAVQDWDAYEHLWESAMETMTVRRHKHSTGEPTRHSKDAATNNNNSNIISSNKDALPGSTTIRPTAPEYQCMHPLMALTPGFTYPSLAPDGSYRPSAVKAARRQEMVKTLELLLETFDAPAAFLAPEPMVAAFSQGRSVALVVDVGAGGSRVTPVVDGLVLSQAQRRSGRGGDWLVNNAWQGLQAVTPLRPRYQLQRGVVDPTIQAKGIFHRWAMQDVVWECTSALCKMPWPSAVTEPLFAPARPAKKKSKDDDDKEDGDEDDEEEEEEEDDPMETDETPANTAPTSTFELPDGTSVDLTTPTARDLCRLPEAHFIPTLPFGTTACASILAQHDSLTDLPLDELIRASLLAVADVDVRKDLAANILLVGGASQGLEERLSWRLRHMLPGKPKVLASAHSIERTAASWIGGSILSSLGSFQQLWLGRTEYEEYGPALALQRFPV